MTQCDRVFKAPKMAINYRFGYDPTWPRLMLVREGGKLLTNLRQHVQNDDKLLTLQWRNAIASSTSKMTVDYYHFLYYAMQLGPPYVDDKVKLFSTDTKRPKWR